MTRLTLPRGYDHARHPVGEVVVWREAADWARSTLAHTSLHDWAASQPDRIDFAGRGLVYGPAAPLAGPDGRARWAVRRYRRGGAMAMHMGERYLRLRTPRPFREIAASEESRSRGIRTPAAVAGATYVSGLYYRCDLITEVVPDVHTLADQLQAHDGTREWLHCMARAGDLIRSLAEAGVHHVDLNARNILLSEDRREPAWVVDLDRARLLRGPSPRARDRMELRLVRSIVKTGTPTGEALRDGELLAALATRNSDL